MPSTMNTTCSRSATQSSSDICSNGSFGNPAFWLRVGVGVLFPFALAVLSWRAANIRGMMTATGLLYIATGCILAGEVLARGLLFATGAVV